MEKTEYSVSLYTGFAVTEKWFDLKELFFTTEYLYL
jgi:hypothetical protein